MIFPYLDELLGLRCEVQGLHLHARRASHAQISGMHRSVHRGRGLEFQEVREYASGDDPRTIDWRVTARRGRPHTKLYREERERPVWLLVDLSATMFFGSRVQLKSTVAVNAAALLAWSAALAGDRVGAVVIGTNSSQIIPPRAREAGVLQTLLKLTQMQPRAAVKPSNIAFAEAVGSLVSSVRAGSLVLVLSDFASVAATDAGDWTGLGRRNDLRFYPISDPLERQGLPEGRFRVWLPEGPVSLDGENIRRRWETQWQAHKVRIEELAQRAAAPLIELDTRCTVTDLVRKILPAKQAAA